MDNFDYDVVVAVQRVVPVPLTLPTEDGALDKIRLLEP